MANIEDSLNELMAIEGAMGGCVVDYTSGLSLGISGGGVDLELAAAGNSEVVKAKMSTMKNLGINGEIEDILITLQEQLHIIKPTMNHEGLFIYLVLSKERSNLALARRKVGDIDSRLDV